MTNFDNNLDFINEVYKNAHVALQAISNVLDSVEDASFKKELLYEYKGYENLISEISAYMAEKGYETKELGTMKKVMMKTGIKMNTAFNDSVSHIAKIMIKGTVMGITELCSLLNDVTEKIDEEVITFAKKLKTLEEQYEERLKKFL